MQQCLNKLCHWAETNGFKFSSSKTVSISVDYISYTQILRFSSMVHQFLSRRKQNSLPSSLTLKLSFLPHIRHLKDKYVKALNMLHVLAHTSWGADQETLLHYIFTYS